MELLACPQIPQNQDENWMWCFSFLLLSNKVNKRKTNNNNYKIKNTHCTSIYSMRPEHNLSFIWLYETNVVGRALIFSLMTYLGLCFSMWFVEEYIFPWGEPSVFWNRSVTRSILLKMNYSRQLYYVLYTMYTYNVCSQSTYCTLNLWKSH